MMVDIVGMCCVLNEEEFIKCFVTNAMALVNKLIIAEGAVIGHPFCDSAGHSTDRTNEILDDMKVIYKDRLIIIRQDHKWSSKQEQQNVMLNEMEDGQWAWIFGADEFYNPWASVTIRSLIRKYPDITEFVFPIIHFWSDMKHIIVDDERLDYRMLQRHQRLFKFRDYMFYVNHPTINDVENRDIFFHEHYNDKRMYLDVPDYVKQLFLGRINRVNVITMYHYGFCRSRNHQLKKHIYYLMRDRDMTVQESIDFVMGKVGGDLKKVYGYIEQIHNEGAIKIIEYDDKHPLRNITLKSDDVKVEDLLKSIVNFDEIPLK